MMMTMYGSGPSSSASEKSEGVAPSKSLLYWSMWRTRREASSLRPADPFADGVAEGIGGPAWPRCDGREEMGNALVDAELDAFGIDEDEADLRGRGAIQQTHNRWR